MPGIHSSVFYFNSRPCGRGDVGPPRYQLSALVFQFTPLREGRRGREKSHGREQYFNSRPCGRGDYKNVASSFAADFISIHAPAGGATDSGLDDIKEQYISIHAPAGGATLAYLMKWIAKKFQFTPLREGRPEAVTLFDREFIFQFTPLREGRLDSLKDIFNVMLISIHAPAGGATVAAAGQVKPDKFQFTPLREGRLMSIGVSLKPSGFQFTPLREGRRRHDPPSLVPAYFNSRPCGRGDRAAGTYRKINFYFNSRPCGRGDTATRPR